MDSKQQHQDSQNHPTPESPAGYLGATKNNIQLREDYDQSSDFTKDFTVEAKSFPLPLTTTSEGRLSRVFVGHPLAHDESIDRERGRRKHLKGNQL
ncbi:MAG: hypothetical protein QOJ16_2724 [Acidobacteriota bacterium]|nr:hypothetical protein [Acidobacteriota bacterium]